MNYVGVSVDFEATRKEIKELKCLDFGKALEKQ